MAANSAAADGTKGRSPTRKFVWYQYSDTGFASRVNHATSLIHHGNDTYLYSVGGFHKDDAQRVFDVLENYDDDDPESAQDTTFNTGPIDVQCMNIETRTWKKVDAKCTTKDPTILIRDEVPPRRYGHTCIGYRGKIFMFGGRNDDDGSFNTVECFDTEKKMWLKIHMVDKEGPKSRDGHACSNIGKDMYLHGGFEMASLQFTSDMFVFDMENYLWRKLEKKGDLVSHRDFHNAVCTDDRVVVFGGRSDRYAPSFTGHEIYDSFFYEYVLGESRWIKVETNGYQPEGRRSAAATRYGRDSVVFFGGYNNMLKRHFNDVFIYNTKTKLVTEVKPYGVGPSPRRRAGCGYYNGEFIICGGTCPVKKTINGKELEMLHDTNEMYILNFLPSLKELCMMVVKENDIDMSLLPGRIREEVNQF